MKTTNALMAAALAGVFAAGTTVSHANILNGSPVAADKEKEKCDGKDKDGCPGKKEKKEGTLLASVTADDAEKDKCDGKDKGKDKDGCPGKEKKEASIL